MRKTLAATLLSLTTLAFTLATAQEIQPITPNPTTPVTPGTVEPLPVPRPATPPASQPTPNPLPTTPTAPASLPGVNATLTSPLTLKGKATLVLTLKSTLAKDVALMTNRDNRQNCAFAPSIRVIKVGSKDVVYPDGSGNVMLCAQDMSTQTLKANGTLRYTRTLELPAGEYMIESWYLGSVDGTRVKIGAQPVKVTVK